MVRNFLKGLIKDPTYEMENGLSGMRMVKRNQREVDVYDSLANPPKWGEKNGIWFYWSEDGQKTEGNFQRW